jgi:hypothetical protein
LDEHQVGIVSSTESDMVDGSGSGIPTDTPGETFDIHDGSKSHGAPAVTENGSDLFLELEAKMIEKDLGGALESLDLDEDAVHAGDRLAGGVWGFNDIDGEAVGVEHAE